MNRYGLFLPERHFRSGIIWLMCGATDFLERLENLTFVRYHPALHFHFGWRVTAAPRGLMRKGVFVDFRLRPLKGEM